MHKFTFFIGLFFYIVLHGCGEDSFSIGKELVYSSSNVIVCDTFSIKTYTIKSDTFQTSGKNKALVGSYTDGNLGTITAKSFFQIGQSTTNKIDQWSSFDSITLITPITNSSYGDTTKSFTLEVHELSQKLEELKNNSNYICNTKQAAYNTEILGQRTFIPHPGKSKTVFSIKLSYNFGKSIFDLIKQVSTTYTNAENFYNFFKGLALVPSPGTNSAILRFATDSARLRIYYHLDVNHFTLDLPIRNNNLQFNYIKSDFTGSPLIGLKRTSDKLSSATAGLNGTSYVQPGAGIMTRIEFPFIRNLEFSDKKTKIISATLIISPVQDEMTLPSPLNLYWTDIANNLTSALTNSSNAAVTSTLYTDPAHIQTAYTFDVTSFVANQAVTTNTTELPALILTSAFADSASLQRVILASPKRTVNPPRLRVTYWRY